MKLKTGILMLLVGIAMLGLIIGTASSDETDVDSEGKDKDSKFSKVKLEAPKGCIKVLLPGKQSKVEQVSQLLLKSTELQRNAFPAFIPEQLSQLLLDQPKELGIDIRADLSFRLGASDVPQISQLETLLHVLCREDFLYKLCVDPRAELHLPPGHQFDLLGEGKIHLIDPVESPEALIDPGISNGTD